MEAVDFLLNKMNENDIDIGDTKLMLVPGKKELTYHRRFTIVGKDGKKHRSSEKLGDERNPRVIAAKQQKYNATLKAKLLKAKKFLIYDQLTFLGISFQCDVDVPLKDESGARIYKDADYLIGVVHGRKLILEHLGMLTSESYVNKAIWKLRLYVQNGYTLNKDLFLTADNRNGKINAHATMQLLHSMILPKTRTSR